MQNLGPKKLAMFYSAQQAVLAQSDGHDDTARHPRIGPSLHRVRRQSRQPTRATNQTRGSCTANLEQRRTLRHAGHSLSRRYPTRLLATDVTLDAKPSIVKESLQSYTCPWWKRALHRTRRLRRQIDPTTPSTAMTTWSSQPLATTKRHRALRRHQHQIPQTTKTTTYPKPIRIPSPLPALVSSSHGAPGVPLRRGRRRLHRERRAKTTTTNAPRPPRLSPHGARPARKPSTMCPENARTTSKTHRLSPPSSGLENPSRRCGERRRGHIPTDPGRQKRARQCRHELDDVRRAYLGVLRAGIDERVVARGRARMSYG
ncbi:hypothetical protein DFP72DRAFT_1098711 [Ephemerocybe angulata]|uniref:Uncharacterized protein n=1 Tax=Ephemerocybe angulata TaxID=980116 RepID=A0A8H6I6C9_9AGAR|nr:hypothetical protein DFP72DRAFT_1098711 [Tulosesus angulatus]